MVDLPVTVAGLPETLVPLPAALLAADVPVIREVVLLSLPDLIPCGVLSCADRETELLSRLLMEPLLRDLSLLPGFVLL